MPPWDPWDTGLWVNLTQIFFLAFGSAPPPPLRDWVFSWWLPSRPIFRSGSLQFFLRLFRSIDLIDLSIISTVVYAIVRSTLHSVLLRLLDLITTSINSTGVLRLLRLIELITSSINSTVVLLHHLWITNSWSGDFYSYYRYVKSVFVKL